MARSLTLLHFAKSMAPLDVLSLVISKLNELGIQYMVGGSFASSVHGFVRNTQDADLIVDMPSDAVAALVESLRRDFYIDRNMVQQALLRGSSFSVVHFQTAFKLDFFVLSEDTYARKSFSRRILSAIYPEGRVQGFVQTPDDTILAKLRWFRQGGEISETQWRDVIGIIKSQSDRLDETYLRLWAQHLALSDLLQRARHDAGMPMD
jgi:hypothetical protein